MRSHRDSTRDILIARNEELARKLRERDKQLSAAIADNRELRRRLDIRAMSKVAA